MVRVTKLSDAARDVLAACSFGVDLVDGVLIYLPNRVLERPLYVEVDKALRTLGCTWNKKRKAHAFSVVETDDAAVDEIAARLGDIVDTGLFVRPESNGYFPTPQAVVSRLLHAAEIAIDHAVLEPSAGQGHIADEIRPLVSPGNLIVVELLPQNRAVLERKGYEIAHDDFLTYRPSRPFDRVVMNPPFEHGAALDHVERAFAMVKRGGRLVAIMPSSITFRQDRRHRSVRALIERYGEIEPLPVGSFRESGTDVNTVLVVVTYR